jgi:imidazolonepropionase-like amidohydrolase
MLLNLKSLKRTLLIQNGKDCRWATVVIPKNCTTINLDGKSIYPSFIDMYTSFGIEKPRMGSNEEILYTIPKIWTLLERKHKIKSTDMKVLNTTNPKQKSY